MSNRDDERYNVLTIDSLRDILDLKEVRERGDDKVWIRYQGREHRIDSITLGLGTDYGKLLLNVR